MGKVYVRVDDRLIHGQTIVAWCPALGIKEIIGIDDESAKNPTIKSIMKMSVPSSYKTDIVTTEEAITLLKTGSGDNRLIIVKSPGKLPQIAEAIKGSEYIMLGNISKRPDSVHKLGGATGIFYLSDQDVKDIDGLVKQGFTVNFQQLPNTAKTGWDSFRKTIKLGGERT
ncbi:MAG: PTS sugar transporter subunit IIB [Treponema sp.]|jgi:mannose/fructose/N-acetylgalactosamine-specific phosphotransferase system component IIB|nr:PTS sugar transporter subunit IIB [Treponema sp.]